MAWLLMQQYAPTMCCCISLLHDDPLCLRAQTALNMQIAADESMIDVCMRLNLVIVGL